MQRLVKYTLTMALIVLWSLAQASAEEPGVTPAELRSMALTGSYAFSYERDNPATEGIGRKILRFQVDGLTQYALLLWPAGTVPEEGWPVVQFNHGFHPNPPLNGFNAAGQSDRPGDYYRETVQAFAREGFAVIVPDFRGHNISQGADFTARVPADAWYSRDAIACFLALESISGLNLEHAYMLGHSMGGPITVRAMTALGNRVRAGSVWSSAAVTFEETSVTDQETLLLSPLSIQHSLEDQSTPATNALQLADHMKLTGAGYQLKVYPGSDHLFTGKTFSAAVTRDVQWFQRHR
jgi:dipeptidyl aminopeptidase/acylaminoacyl peptidase